MKPEQKAKELVGIYLMSRVTIRTTLDSIPTRINGVIDFEDAKKLALIAVEEIIKEFEQLRKPEYTIFIISYEGQITMDGYEKLSYWQQVKTEIEKL